MTEPTDVLEGARFPLDRVFVSVEGYVHGIDVLVTLANLSDAIAEEVDDRDVDPDTVKVRIHWESLGHGGAALAVDFDALDREGRGMYQLEEKLNARMTANNPGRMGTTYPWPVT